MSSLMFVFDNEMAISSIGMFFLAIDTLGKWLRLWESAILFVMFFFRKNNGAVFSFFLILLFPLTNRKKCEKEREERRVRGSRLLACVQMDQSEKLLHAPQIGRVRKFVNPKFGVRKRKREGRKKRCSNNGGKEMKDVRIRKRKKEKGNLRKSQGDSALDPLPSLPPLILSREVPTPFL